MEPKTPVLQDKRLFVTVGAVISVLVSRYLGIDLQPEDLATIALLVVGWVTNSAVREAKVAGANAAAAIGTPAQAVNIINAPGPNP